MATGGSAVHGWPVQGCTSVVDVVEVLVVEVEVVEVLVVEVLVVDVLEVELDVDVELVVVCASAPDAIAHAVQATSTAKVRLAIVRLLFAVDQSCS